jgi:putative ABC transport system permease protein
MRAVLRLALHNLRHALLRSGLSALAVAMGVATLVAAELMSQAVTSEIVRTAESEAITAFMTEQLNVGLTVIGLVVTIGAAFIMFNTFSMAMAQRREDLGRLRTSGMTRVQGLAMILTEAGIIGAAGALLGSGGGILLTRGLLALVQATSEMFNRFGTPQVSTARLMTAGGLGLLASVLAAGSPALQAIRVPPLAALRPSTSRPMQRASRLPVITGAVLAGGMWTYLALDPPGRWILPPWSDVLSALFAVLWLTALAISLPALADGGGAVLRRLLSRVAGPSGILAADNLRRSRSRIVLTMATLAIGVAMIVGVTGYLTYWFDELFFRNADASLKTNPGLGFFPINVDAGLEAYAGLTSFTLPGDLREELTKIVGTRGVVVEAFFVLAPELSFLGDRYFSYVLDPREMHNAGELFFSFTYGSWEDALGIIDRGCALFVTPTVARKNSAWLNDTLRLKTPFGGLDCTIAGIGPTFVGASIISDAALSAFRLSAPVNLTVFPRTPADREVLTPELEQLAARFPGVWLIDLARLTEMQREGMKSIQAVMDGMLLLAVISAALGVVNLAVVSLTERRREFGILRAAGATRFQVHGILILEGLLLGGLGALVGTLAGAGVVMSYVVVTAGSAMGFSEFPIWETAWSTVQPALARGLLAGIATPALTALAAWLPARRALRGSVVEILNEGTRPW